MSTSMIPLDEIPESPHTQAARELMGRVRELQQLAGNTTILQAAQRKKFNTTASVSDEAIESVAVLFERYPALAALCEANPAKMRDAINYSRALSPVIAELKLAIIILQQAILGRRSEAGDQVFKAYTLARRLNRRGDKTLLVPHVEALRAMIVRRGKKAEKADPPVEKKPLPTA